MNPSVVAKLVYAISRDPALQHHAMVAKLNQEFAGMTDSSKLVFGDAAKKVNQTPLTNWQLENELQGYKNQAERLTNKIQERDKALEKLEAKLRKLEKKLTEAEAERYRSVVMLDVVRNNFYDIMTDDDEIQQIKKRYKEVEAKAAKWDALTLLIGEPEAKQ
ncbi:hypothetical protein [Asticcacaulis sp.]|uniref:hypothetical protein n=1 Tax=Asticcacaulis sp. TaxID=1872648 RepID=UPI00391DF851